LAGAAALLSLLAWLAPRVGLEPKSLSEGLPRLWEAQKGLLSVPEWGAFPMIASALFESLEMAFVGTVAATPVCFFFSLLVAQNTSFHPWVAAGFRGLVALLRAVPFLVIAMVLVAMVGLGAMAGTLALVISSLTMGAKLFADSLEHVDPGPVEGVTAAGASALGIRRFGIVQQALAEVGSQAMFLFELNLRLSVAVGLVGAGGIGYQMAIATKSARFGVVSLILLSILVMVSAVEFVGKVVRRRLS
jgi:phosphonate transport system permease protein